MGIYNKVSLRRKNITSVYLKQRALITTLPLSTTNRMKYSCSIVFLVAHGVITPLILAQSQLPGQFSGVSGALGVFGSILDMVSRFQKARLIEHPSSGKCINIENALIGSGIKIIMYDCNWRNIFTPVNELFYAVEADGAYLLKGSASYSNMCAYTGTNHNDPLYTTGCNTGDNKQQFEFRKVVDNEYQLVQRATGRCLRADGRGNGAGIRAVNCDTNDHEQRWRICNGDRNCN